MAKKERALKLGQLLNGIDRKRRDFLDTLDDQQRKEYSGYVSLRWASSIARDGDLAAYYVLSANQQANKHFWAMNKHPKLQWLMISAVSPNMGVYEHEFIAFKGNQTKNSKAALLAKLYPAMKLREVDQLSDIITDSEMKDLLRDMGWEDKQIKEALK